METSNNPLPHNEKERVEGLKKLNIMDTLPEKQFDDITRLASIICKMPITLITLIDKDRQWFKSKIGLDGNETPRNVSFCQYAILNEQVFEVENALEDERFVNNPFVTGTPDVRFYAGAPLTTVEGYNVGTLCVIDTKPNKLSDEQKEALKILANEVVTHMELRRERYKLEQEKLIVSESNELLNAFLENSPSMVTIKDISGKYMYVNTNAAKVINRDPLSLIGLSAYDISSKELADEISGNEAELKASLQTTRKTYQRGEGENARYFISYMFPLFDNKKELYGIGTITNDVSEAKKIEIDLEKSNERFLKIFNDSPVGMMLMNIKERRVISANKAFLTIFEFDGNEQVVGKPVAELNMSSAEEQMRISEMQKEKGFLLNEEIYCITAKGSLLTALFSVNMLDINNQVCLMSYVDITDRKILETQLIEAKKLAEQATVSKSSFLANMSHEIRTPLNAMIGFADLLDSTPLNAKQKDYLSAIEVSGKNLLTIINDILDFSKIEAGMLSIECIPFSPQQLIHSVYTMFANKAQIRNIKLFISIDSKIPPLVMGDPTRLNQIMINLLGNAIKFTNEGSVTVDCEATLLDAQHVKLKITVKDTGIGIAADKLQTIFERFTQAESNTSRSYGGTGLGLSIAKKLAELQGGQISVNSTQGLGSEFIVDIAYEIAKEEQAQTDNVIGEEIQMLFKGKKVLVVEDNKLNQKLAQVVLTDEGFEVEIAGNGQIAVDLLKDKSFDIILMDLQMPELDGYEATKKIRRELHLTTPIIAMTANAMAGEKERCITAGMDDYITKPFNPDMLFNMIHKFLAR